MCFLEGIPPEARNAWWARGKFSAWSPGQAVDMIQRSHTCGGAPARQIAKLVNITLIKPMVYGRYNELVNGVNLNQLITAPSHNHIPLWIPEGESMRCIDLDFFNGLARGVLGPLWVKPPVRFMEDPIGLG